MSCQAVTSLDIYVPIGADWEDYYALFSDPDGSLDQQLWSGDETPFDLTGWTPRAQARATLLSPTPLAEMSVTYCGPVVLTAAAVQNALTLSVQPLPCPLQNQYTLNFGGVAVQLTADAAKGDTALRVMPTPLSLASGAAAPSGTVRLSLTAAQTAALTPSAGIWDLELYQGTVLFFQDPDDRPSGKWRAGLPGVTR